MSIDHRWKFERLLRLAFTEHVSGFACFIYNYNILKLLREMSLCCGLFHSYENSLYNTPSIKAFDCKRFILPPVIVSYTFYITDFVYGLYRWNKDVHIFSYYKNKNKRRRIWTVNVLLFIITAILVTINN